MRSLASRLYVTRKTLIDTNYRFFIDGDIWDMVEWHRLKSLMDTKWKMNMEEKVEDEMTFEELLAQLADDYLNPPKRPDGSKDCDQNGHTRITHLQFQYKLSSLKIQKLLVTAGVYEPVKSSSPYYAIKRLYEAGESVDKIMEQLSLSKATVNACIPYERGAKELDKIGVGITGDAVRKRRQRSVEEMKKENARDILILYPSDGALWSALQEHDQEVFITSSGQRFRISVLHGAMGGQATGRDILMLDELIVTHVDADGKIGDIIHVSKDHVFDAYKAALQNKSAGETVLCGIDYAEYLSPVFVFLGVIEGDRSKVTTKRNVGEAERCSCCGRRAERLFHVCSLDDLGLLDKQFTREREENWTDREKEQAQMLKALGITSSDEELERAWQNRIDRVRNSKVVQAFNADGERMLCKRCAASIFSALEDGDTPALSVGASYEKMNVDEIWQMVEERLSVFPTGVLFGVEGRGYITEKQITDLKTVVDLDKEELREKLASNFQFFFRAMDDKGQEHFFALHLTGLDYSEGDIGLSYTATEIHRMTKAGKLSVQNADTKYTIEHFRMLQKEDDDRVEIGIGFLEVIDKIRNTLINPSLDEEGRMRSTGSFRLVYNDGDLYNFEVDGKEYTPEEFDRLFSGYEGWRVDFSIEDPTGDVLHKGEILMPMMLGQTELTNETVELLNMFTKDGEFISKHDEENFSRLFSRYLLPKIRIYYTNNARGHGRLACLSVIKTLGWVSGTEEYQKLVREVIRF